MHIQNEIYKDWSYNASAYNVQFPTELQEGLDNLKGRTK